MRLWFVCLLLPLCLCIQAQDRIWLSNGNVLSNVQVKPTDWKEFAITYERNGRRKLLSMLDVVRIDYGDSAAYNLAYRGRANIKTYGRPNQAELSVFVGYSLLGAKNGFESVFAKNNLINYESTGLFGVYKDSGKSVVYSNGGLGARLDVLMSQNSVFFIQYYYYNYGVRGQGALTHSYYSRPSVRTDFAYHQHSFVLGVGRIVSVPVVRTKAALKAGVLIMGSKIKDTNTENLKLTMTETGTFGLFGEASLTVWSTEKLAVNAFCQYYYTKPSRLHSDFSRSYSESGGDPSYQWQDGYIQNHRLLAGISMGFRF